MALSRQMRSSAGAPARSTSSPKLSVPRAAAVEAVPKTYTGKTVAPPKHGKHFLHLDDFSKEEILDMLARAEEAKARLKVRDATFKPFKDMSMAMIFTKPSARTRVSFETVRRCSSSRRRAAGLLVARGWLLYTLPGAGFQAQQALQPTAIGRNCASLAQQQTLPAAAMMGVAHPAMQSSST